MSITVGIVEDDEQLRIGTQAILNGSQGFFCDLVFANAERALPALLKMPVDVVLMDIRLGGKDGIWCISELRRCSYPGEILVLSVFDDDDIVFDALQKGASGYLLKDSQPIVLLDAIREVHAGGSPMTASIARKVLRHFRDLRAPVRSSKLDERLLSPREKELLEEVMRGSKYIEIAEALGISLNTVKGHVRSIYEKLQVSSRAELMAKARVD